MSWITAPRGSLRRQGLGGSAGGKDRHDERSPRQLVRRLLTRADDARLGGLRRQTERPACRARAPRCRSGAAIIWKVAARAAATPTSYRPDGIELATIDPLSGMRCDARPVPTPCARSSSRVTPPGNTGYHPTAAAAWDRQHQPPAKADVSGRRQRSGEEAGRGGRGCSGGRRKKKKDGWGCGWVARGGFPRPTAHEPT